MKMEIEKGRKRGRERTKWERIRGSKGAREEVKNRG